MLMGIKTKVTLLSASTVNDSDNVDPTHRHSSGTAGHRVGH
jgi:hypothetical protein